MKRKHFNLAGIFVFLLCALLGVMNGDSLMALDANQTSLPGAGVMQKGDPQTANNNVQGVTRDGTEAASANLIKRSVDTEITKIRPCFTPIDTILRTMGSQPVNDMKFNYYSVGTIPFSTTCTAYARGSQVSGLYYGTITVSDTSIFVPSSTVKLHCYELTTPSGGTQSGAYVDYVFYVVSIDTTNKTLTVAYGGASAPAASTGSGSTWTDGIVVSGTVGSVTVTSTVYRLGRAAAEGEKQTINIATMPTDEYNYCQIFKWQVAATAIEQMVDKEVKWTLSDMEEEAAINFKMEMEGSFLFGRKCVYYDNVKGKKLYAMGGIVDGITKAYSFNTSNGEKEIIDLCKYVFQGNIGNRKRMMFVGSDFNAALSKLLITNSGRRLTATDTKVIAGMEFEVLRSNFGQLWIMQHDLLDQYGWKNKAIILDMDNIKRKVFYTKTTKISESQNNEFEGDISIYTEAVGVAVKYPDTHCIVSLAS